MKRIYIIALSAIASLSVYGCSTPQVEKTPVVIEEESNYTTDQIKHTDPLLAEDDAMEKETTSDTNPAEDLSYSDTDNQDKAPNADTTNTSDEPYQMTIELEGMEEQINCKTYQSPLGYLMSYDIDRFQVSSENNIDQYFAENPNPELYPYVFLNVTRSELPVTSDSSKSNTIQVMDSENQILGYLPEGNLKFEKAEPIMIGGTEAVHYTAKSGTEWNSTVHHYYYLKADQYVYTFETQYFLEAAEGYGARIQAMLDTFKLQ